ncbi:MAG: DUF5320 domain-containing protein [Candidatus Omnitrophica bacterium]|nr:DUF5320 domain-containing protein [Candidatus Omnitrophota bacterium]
MFGGRGHRYMYYATGLPGWMRFGYSPGWGTVPPGAQFLTTGSWSTPQANAFWQNYQRQGRFVPLWGQGSFASQNLTKEQELNYLMQQAENLKSQLEEIERRIKELEG